MTQPEDRDQQVEHDPTGMRDLLAGLPDPGPMPDDLVVRIREALAVEARVVPLHGGHRSRPGIRLRHVGVAAAVVTAVALGGYALGGLSGSGVTASMTARGATSGSESQADSGGGSAAKGSDSVAPLAPQAGSGGVVVVRSGLEYGSSRLAATAREVDEGTIVPLPDLSAEAPAIGPIATPIGARSCADGLGIPAGAGLLVDIADVDGKPAAVLVVHDDRGRTAYAVERSCTAGASGLLHGPVPLDE